MAWHGIRELPLPAPMRASLSPFYVRVGLGLHRRGADENVGPIVFQANMYVINCNACNVDARQNAQSPGSFLSPSPPFYSRSGGTRSRATCAVSICRQDVYGIQGERGDGADGWGF